MHLNSELQTKQFASSRNMQKSGTNVQQLYCKVQLTLYTFLHCILRITVLPMVESAFVRPFLIWY